jgi:hypothetical protein
MMRRCATIVACAILGCAAPHPDRIPSTGSAAAPNVTCAGDAFLVSWIEGPGDAPRLAVARRDARGWTAPLPVIEGRPLLVNWADFPAVLALDEGPLVAQWLERSPGSTFAYGVQIATSSDGGRTWSPPYRPHTDVPSAEFGFVSLVDDGRGFAALWLDGRGIDAAGSGTMSLRLRTWRGGAWGGERMIDDDVCTCCQTSAASVPGAILVAYRDHTGPTRDVSVMAIDDAGTVRRAAFPRDGWTIAGCPVNGPALAARGAAVAVAWYTEASAAPRVLLAVSTDGGYAFGEPVRVDDGSALGRVDVALLTDDRIVVSWLEGAAEGDAEVRVRSFEPTGRPVRAWSIGRVRRAPAAGFPRLAACGGRIGVTWTAADAPDGPRLSVLDPADQRAATVSASVMAWATRDGSGASRNALHAATP